MNCQQHKRDKQYWIGLDGSGYTSSETVRCINEAVFRYTWPGEDESFICGECVVKLKTIAQAIGLHLQVIPL